MARKTRFSIWRFCLLIVPPQFILLLLTIRLAVPRIWTREVAAGPLAFLLTFLGMLLFNCFAEWFIHRYFLHSKIVGGVQSWANGHRHHHDLTSIKLRQAEVGKGYIVLCDYSIVRDEQFEDSAFPAYAVTGFWILFTPLLIGVKLLFPGLPVLLAGYSAILWSATTYEVFHAIEHLPYAWWKGATEHERFGGFWCKVYGFHHFHHANINANEAISGFFGLPIADWVFRTYHQPPELLLHDYIATAKDVLKVPPPLPFIGRLDKWAHKREVKISARSKRAPRPFIEPKP